MKISIACDHGAFDMKEAVKAHLTAQGHEVSDFGCHSLASCDYPDMVAPAAQAVANGETDTDSLALLEEETPEEGVTEVSTEKKSSVSAADNNPEQLLQQGFSFLSGLARTLSSPEV